MRSKNKKLSAPFGINLYILKNHDSVSISDLPLWWSALDLFSQPEERELMIMSGAGQTSFCLDCFSENAKINIPGRSNSRAQKNLRKRICDLLGIRSSVGHSWFVRGFMPNGLHLIKLRYLLKFVGFHLTDEARSLTSEQCNLANYLALSVVTVKGMAGVLGVNPNTVMNWATGRSTPNDRHAHDVKKCLKGFATDAERERRYWLETLRSLNLISGPKTRRAEEHVVNPAAPEIDFSASVPSSA